MNRSWRFTETEFFALWEHVTTDYHPAPFLYTSRTQSHQEFEREKRQKLADLDRRLGYDFRARIAEMARPDIRITAFGVDETVRGESPAVRVRVLATRKGSRGYTVVQHPGESYWYGGGYTMTECEAVSLGNAVVDLLPTCDPGRHNEIPLPPAPTPADHDAPSRIFATAGAASSRHHRDFMIPSVCAGTIEVAQGDSIYGPDGLISRTLTWRDVPGDGRYAVNDTTPLVATSVTADRLVSMVNARVSTIVKALRAERS
ncbi:ESX secretion-associated protein EspG [Nocardia sp. NPDC058519]|uniref:ESX secretion-associated protein EspG n=1 Tax=Nocardia sp. NPDC058519 TaxID=3346535 RepID=UPI0036599C3F